jgi:ceramide glucosyltransferase
MAERTSGESGIFVLSDADVSVEPDHLDRVIGEITEDPSVGIVTCPYRARPTRGLASRIAALFINTDFAPQIILAQHIEPMRYALGATIAIRREALEKIGGFRALGPHLADDFYIGKLVSDRGYAVRLSSSIVTVDCEERDFQDFWNHQLRWARTYRCVRPLSLATIFTKPALGGSLSAREFRIRYLVARVLDGDYCADSDGWSRHE